MILHRGDPISGAILVQTLHQGQPGAILEKISSIGSSVSSVSSGSSGSSVSSGWIALGPDSKADDAARSAYIERRIHNDPDLWVVELDSAGGEEFSATGEFLLDFAALQHNSC